MTETTRRNLFSIWTLGERLARGEEMKDGARRTPPPDPRAATVPEVPVPEVPGTSVPEVPGTSGGGGCGSGCGCAGGDGSGEPAPAPAVSAAEQSAVERPMTRRGLLGLFGAATAGAAAVAATGCSPTGEAMERAALDWQTYFQGNYRVMTDEEKRRTIERLERRWEMEHGDRVEISADGPVPGVLYGYAFNVSRCKGYMDCVRACVQENNLDRGSDIQYIRIFEMENGTMDFAESYCQMLWIG